MLQYVCVMGRVNETKSLAAIIEKFDESSEALSVVRLIDEFSDMMNRTTVYRILSRLEEKGVLHSFIGHGGLKWYAKTKPSSLEETKATHPLFQCEDCGKTECLPIDVAVPILPEHQIKTVSFLIVGSCGNCNTHD